MMKRYHIITAWGSDLCRQGFDTLSEAIEMAYEFCSFIFMLYGDEMEFQVECHEGGRKRRVAMVLHTVKVVMLDDAEE